MKSSGKKSADRKRGRARLAAIVAGCAIVAVVVAVTVTGDELPAGTVGIRDWHELHAIREDLSGSYVLMNDLDATTAGYQELASGTANNGSGWEPIGQIHFTEQGPSGDPFEGTFDGRGYEVRDLLINRPDENTAGLFGLVGEGGVLLNVGVVGANVTGYFTVGALAGMNLGVVGGCYSTGGVNGHSSVGGLLGGNGGNIDGSYSTATASGQIVAGGLVGMNNRGTVMDSYATGGVTRANGTNTTFGGFVGRNREGKIVNCYSTGGVHYAEAEGPTGKGFAGDVATGGGYQMTGNYWDVETSGQSSTAGDASGRTTIEMMEVVTYDGWSMIAVDDRDARNTAYTWNMVGGQTYPFLSWQRPF
jgi:hypothetical protein